MYVLPDAELWLVDYLAPLLPGVHVSTRVPNPRQSRMVTVRRDGGPGDRFRDEPRFGIRVWGDKRAEDPLADVADLMAEVRAHMHDAPGDGPCRRWREQSGPVPIPDESGQPLLYLVGEAVLRGADA